VHTPFDSPDLTSVVVSYCDGSTLLKLTLANKKLGKEIEKVSERKITILETKYTRVKAKLDQISEKLENGELIDINMLKMSNSDPFEYFQ